MVDTTGQQDTKIKSGMPGEPAPIAVYAATPFNADTPASSKQPITAPPVEDTDFKYFQRQVLSFSLALQMHGIQWGHSVLQGYCFQALNGSSRIVELHC